MPRLSLLILLGTVTLTGCATKSPLPEDLETVLQNGTKFELISLEPEPTRQEKEQEGAQKWQDKEYLVLGRTTIKDAETRSKLITALETAINSWDNESAACFEPRHVISIEHSGKTYDLEICFACRHLYWFVDRKNSGHIDIGEDQKSVFDDVLKKAGVTLARPH